MMHDVESTAIEAVGHDGKALVIRFRGGREYRYPTAGAEHVEGMRGADSVGRYYNEVIKPHHEHEHR